MRTYHDIYVGAEMKKNVMLKGDTTMQIAICDDVKEYNDQLKRLLKNFIRRNDVISYEINDYTSGFDLLKYFTFGLYDLIFLDVEMPKLDGFETANQIQKIDRDVYIVFATNMEGEIKKGYRYNAKDYLCKPITQEDIDELMNRLIEERIGRQESGFYSIKVKNDGTEYLRRSDILYFESRGHDITAVTAIKEYTFIGKLDKVEAELKHKGFVRIHQSYLVNMEHVFKDMGSKVIMRKMPNSGELPVSNRYKKALGDAFREWVSVKWRK